MPIDVQCGQCGKTLRAPDSAAGRRAKCPECGEPVTIPAPPAEPAYEAEPVYEAEEVDEFEAGFGGGATAGPPRPARRPRAAGLDSEEDFVDDRPRKPCPVCGEEIVATARKCRHCGEVLDPTLGSRGGYGTFSRTKIERFRKEINGLGIFWIFIGSIALIAGIVLVVLADNPDMAVVGVVLMPFALLWLTVGIFTRLKHMWAVYVGLILSYLSAVGNLVGLASGGQNICGIIMMVAAIVQSHRVIGLAREMKDAGVPLRD